MKKLLLSVAALAVLFTACKDDDANPAPQPTKLFLDLVRGNDTITVTYNASKKIALYSYLDARGAGRSYYNEPVYENNRIVKINSADESPTALLLAQSFDYNAAGNIERTKFYDDDGTIYRYDSVAYDNAGRLSALYASEEGKGGIATLAFNEKYAFVWDNKGNITKQYVMEIVDGVETKDTVTTTYTYDDKVNYGAKQNEFYLMEFEGPAFGLSVNNILTEKTVYDDGTEEYTYEYTYDEDNYPVTIKTTSKYNRNGTNDTRVEDTKIRYIKK
jgi:hypothetical protein